MFILKNYSLPLRRKEDLGAMTEFNYPVRQARHLKPQKYWGWIIAIYLYLAGMGAGSFIIGTLIDWSIGPSRFIRIPILNLPFDFSKATLLWGPILVAIGAPFLILDLGIKKRFLYACLNPRTSWVARGFIILSAFMIFGLIFLAKSSFPFKWLYGESVLWHILEIIALAFAFATALYTGVLLKATKSIPLWNTYGLPLLFLVSALSTGLMAIILSMLGSGLLTYDSVMMKILIIGEEGLLVLEGIVLHLFLSIKLKATKHAGGSTRIIWLSERLTLFGGVILLSLLFPGLLRNITSLFRGEVVFMVLAGTLLLSGGFFLRLGVLRAGIRDQIPMKRWIEFQYGLIKNPKPEYRRAQGRSAIGGKSETNLKFIF